VSSPASLGDAPPRALLDFYAAIDDGRFEDAAASFTEDGVYAVPPRGGAEVDPRSVAVGRAALPEFIAARGPRNYRHRIAVCAAEGGSCLAEGVLDLDAGGALRTFALSLQLDRDGLVSRYVAFSCEPITDPALATGDAPRGDAAEVVRRYFAALQQGRFEEAVDFFSPNVTYCHPPYVHGGLKGSGRVWYRGREELLAAFSRRGRTEHLHEIPVLLQRGPNCLFEVVVPGAGGGVSSLSLDDAGRIERYVAFYCEPAIARR
jgi:hypothetical protein